MIRENMLDETRAEKGKLTYPKTSALNLLKEGRTLFVDDFYTSYQLALKLLNSKTYVVKTVCYNKKLMSNFVMSYPLKRGEMIARENHNGTVVLK